jgi:hypothetical protein
MIFHEAYEALKRGEAKAIAPCLPTKGPHADDTIIKLQRPDENSFMTEAYLYKETYNVYGKVSRYPFHVEAKHLALDWMIIE